jgi:hypothetical protein
MEELQKSKALHSRERLKSLGLHFDHIFAKINPIEPKQPQASVVFVITKSSLPPIPPSLENVVDYRNYPVDLDTYLRSQNTGSHPQSVINMCDFVQKGLIYSGNDPITKENAYWYKLQSDDILSSFVAPYDKKIHALHENTKNDDVARGYIILLNNDDMKRYGFTIVETLESCQSKGGKSSLLQIKKRKNITKKRRRVSRRKSRISCRKH